MISGCVDASALGAMLLREPEADAVEARLRRYDHLLIAAPTVVESRIALSRRLGRDVKAEIDGALSRFGIAVIAFSSAHADLAHEAFLRYGKGRHRAALNFGDCMAYATAKVARAELIYVGDDFAQTDLA